MDLQIEAIKVAVRVRPILLNKKGQQQTIKIDGVKSK